MPSENAANKHIPVLLEEVLTELAPVLLAPEKKGTAICFDGTLGGAGHTRAILERFPTRVIASDVDLGAIEAARKLLSEQEAEGRLKLCHAPFSSAIDGLENSSLDAALVDLGYSSNQLESEEFGMSFQLEAPIDMRLQRPPTGASAWDLIQGSSDIELAQIFKSYGEVEQAAHIARCIKQDVATGKLGNSTKELAELIARVSREKNRNIHPATQVFQALRIAVNDELRELDRFLKSATLKLKQGGRLLVISFHSLEDRLVKNFARTGGFRSVQKKPIEASEKELRENPRSRSAKLRVLEKK